MAVLRVSILIRVSIVLYPTHLYRLFSIVQYSIVIFYTIDILYIIHVSNIYSALSLLFLFYFNNNLPG